MAAMDDASMFDDASDDDDEPAEVRFSAAVAVGLPVHGSTQQQDVEGRCHITGRGGAGSQAPKLVAGQLMPKTFLPEKMLLGGADEALPDEELSDDENIDDALADVDWHLGSAIGRYKQVAGGGQMNSNANRVHLKTYDDENFQPIERSKLFSKISVGRVDENTDERFTKRVNQSVRAIVASDDKERVRDRDKADRATVEQVIDPRTRMILFKLLKNDYIQEIYGTISTGKEANVYHSVAGLTLDEVGRAKDAFLSKAAVSRAEKKAARQAAAAEDTSDEALVSRPALVATA